MSNYFSKTGPRTQLLEKLREKLKETSSPNNFREEDDRFWKLEVDKSGTGYAVIRFLPSHESDPCTYATIFSHGFQGPGGKWYIENCPTGPRASTTSSGVNKECPACEANTELWSTGTEENKAIVRNRKRRQNFISNILVIKDPKHPENEGKVFLYRYGKEIFNKINDLLFPPAEFGDMKSIDAFDPYLGATFKLRVMKQNGYPSYEKSTFDAAAPLFNGDEDKIAALESKIYPLAELMDDKKFKSYADLKARLALVLKDKPDSSAVSKASMEMDEEVIAPRPAATRASRSQPAAKAKPIAAVAVAEEDDEEDDYFAKLAQGDDD